jgi:lipoprotein-releasing system permease protein
MRFEFFIAARYLRAKRRQAVVGVITAISVIGVASGVASLILALAITNGMRRELQERLVGSTAHVDLMRIAADGMRDWHPLLERLRRVPHVTAAAPGFYGQVLISRGARSGGALIKGIIPQDERTVGDLLQSVAEGSAAALEPVSSSAGVDIHGVPPIVIGKDLAETLGAKVGDSVLVTSPQGELTPLGLVPRYQRFQVVGIFKSGFYQYDSSYTFTRLADAQRLFSEPDLISVISFKVDDLYRADKIGHAIEIEAGKGFQTTNWMEQNRELFRALKLEQVVTFIVLALIVCVAALNILIALTMMVMEKTKDIAVLMSFGVRQEQVRRIFLLQGLLISVIGTMIGLIAGYGLSWLGGHYRFPLDASVYSIDYLPFAPRVWDAVIVAAVSLGVSLIATLYPSASAARVLPAEALRYE